MSITGVYASLLMETKNIGKFGCTCRHRVKKGRIVLLRIDYVIKVSKIKV